MIRWWSIGATIVVLTVFLPETVLCGNVLANVDPRDRDTLSTAWEKRVPGFGQALAISLIHFYQGHIGTRSVSRCPFYISCSRYAERAIAEHGLWGGIVRIIDRYYYREHKGSSLYYPFWVSSCGVLKLDDHYYLSDAAFGWNEDEADIPIDRLLDDSLSIPSFDAKLQESSRLDWARQLFREGDYDRAITVYKEIHYFATDDKLKRICEFQIARCNLGLDRHNSASMWIGQYLSHDGLSTEQLARARLLMGLNYATQRLVPMADMQFQQVSLRDGDGLLAIYLAWMAAERKEWQTAKTGFEKAARFYPPEQSTAEMLGRWANQMDRAEHLHWRSATKAAVLSAIVPGSGQSYCGHIIDGFQALFYVSAFGLATWAAYRYESAFHQPRIGTAVGALFTSTFYIANIWGAQQTALYRNHRFRDELLQPIREGAIQLEFALPSP